MEDPNYIDRLPIALADLSTTASVRLAAEDALCTLERDYAEWKHRTAHALVGTLNAMTNKPHSMTSAGDAVRDDDQYAGWTVKLDRLRHAALSARLEHEVALESLRTVRVQAMIAASVVHV